MHILVAVRFVGSIQLLEIIYIDLTQIKLIFRMPKYQTRIFRLSNSFFTLYPSAWSLMDCHLINLYIPCGMIIVIASTNSIIIYSIFIIKFISFITWDHIRNMNYTLYFDATEAGYIVM